MEELYNGTTKKLRVSRKLTDATTGKQVAVEKVLTVQIKPGWKAGTKIKFPGEGDEMPDGRYQDIEFIIDEAPHSMFTRDGDNLRMTIKLTLGESLLGFSRRVAMLDGKELVVTNKNVTQPDQEFRFADRGMPNQKEPLKKGDLVIHCKVIFPSSLNDQQKELIRQAHL